MKQGQKVVFAIGAHPDDIEFMMGGTLVLLKDAGYESHYMTIANGSCGTTKLSRDEIVKIRVGESREAAKCLGAIFHESLVDDIEIFYEKELLARVAAIVREVNPHILLVPSPQDYMEDHANTSRLAVTAAFCRGMCNFHTIPERPPIERDMTIYHALPYGLCDGLRQIITAELFADIASAMKTKRESLAMHKSQGAWLKEHHAVDHIGIMERMSLDVGKMSGRFKYAEGWRRHNHLGFSAADCDPLLEGLGEKVALEISAVRIA